MRTFSHLASPFRIVYYCKLSSPRTPHHGTFRLSPRLAPRIASPLSSRLSPHSMPPLISLCLSFRLSPRQSPRLSSRLTGFSPRVISSRLLSGLASPFSTRWLSPCLAILARTQDELRQGVAWRGNMWLDSPRLIKPRLISPRLSSGENLISPRFAFASNRVLVASVVLRARTLQWPCCRGKPLIYKFYNVQAIVQSQTESKVIESAVDTAASDSRISRHYFHRDC
jgi:hypothetical protein